jgi:hypothetical protein
MFNYLLFIPIAFGNFFCNKMQMSFTRIITTHQFSHPAAGIFNVYKFCKVDNSVGNVINSALHS